MIMWGCCGLEEFGVKGVWGLGFEFRVRVWGNLG